MFLFRKKEIASDNKKLHVMLSFLSREEAKKPGNITRLIHAEKLNFGMKRVVLIKRAARSVEMAELIQKSFAH